MTTRLAAAVEQRSGRGDAHGPLLAEPVAWAVPDGGVVATAGHRPDGVAPPFGSPPRPRWGVWARRATHVQVQTVPGGHPWAWMHTSVAARGPRRTTTPRPAGARPAGRGPHREVRHET